MTAHTIGWWLVGALWKGEADFWADRNSTRVLDESALAGSAGELETSDEAQRAQKVGLAE